jgi:phosphohistidine swiveling domain-containing protein
VGLLWERELLWHVGNRLVQERLLERPHEVLVLTRQALERIARTGDPASVRAGFRAELAALCRNRRLTPPPFLGTPPRESGTSSHESPPAGEHRREEDTLRVLRGRGLSGHRVTGFARKVTDLRDGNTLSRLTNEDVLVLPHETAFHYADWHSVLTIVRGVVSPGRPSHHLTQVARECGVALVGFIPEELQTIPEGATLHVDGKTGVVEIG